MAGEPDEYKYAYTSRQRSAILVAIGLRGTAGAEALMDELARAAWSAVDHAQNDVGAPAGSTALAQLKRLRHAINSLRPEVRAWVDGALEEAYFPYGQFSLRLDHVVETVETAEETVSEICAETFTDRNGRQRGLRTADEVVGGFIMTCCLLWRNHSGERLPLKVKHAPGKVNAGPETVNRRPTLYRFVHAAMPGEVLECGGKDISHRVNAILPRAHALLKNTGRWHPPAGSAAP